MDRINELRRIAAHPSSTRNYKAADFPFIEYVYVVLKKNIEKFSYDEVISEDESASV